MPSNPPVRNLNGGDRRERGYVSMSSVRLCVLGRGSVEDFA